MEKNKVSDASVSIDQIKKYAKDLAEVYSSEKEKRFNPIHYLINNRFEGESA